MEAAANVRKGLVVLPGFLESPVDPARMEIEEDPVSEESLDLLDRLVHLALPGRQGSQVDLAAPGSPGETGAEDKKELPEILAVADFQATRAALDPWDRLDCAANQVDRVDRVNRVDRAETESLAAKVHLVDRAKMGRMPAIVLVPAAPFSSTNNRLLIPFFIAGTPRTSHFPSYHYIAILVPSILARTRSNPNPNPSLANKPNSIL
jgi:hypothetical protein